MLVRLEGGEIQGKQKLKKRKKKKALKKINQQKKPKTLWHRKSQKEQRAPSNSSSLNLEQMVVWLLVWLLYFG